MIVFQNFLSLHQVCSPLDIKGLCPKKLMKFVHVQIHNKIVFIAVARNSQKLVHVFLFIILKAFHMQCTPNISNQSGSSASLILYTHIDWLVSCLGRLRDQIFMQALECRWFHLNSYLVETKQCGVKQGAPLKRSEQNLPEYMSSFCERY